MKIGMIVDKNGYERFGDEKYKKLYEHGYSCADYNMADTNAGIYVLSEAEATSFILREKALAKEAKIEISQVHGPWTGQRPERTLEGKIQLLNNMKTAMRYTSLIGCNRLVIHPLMPYGCEEAGTETAIKTWNDNIEFMKELVQTAKKYHVIVCIENMPMLNYSLSKPRDIFNVINEVNDENFKMCIDTGHVAAFQELSIGKVVREFGDKIETFHIHDTFPGADLHLMPYFGVIDWIDFAKALKDIEYKGVFSLETLPSRRLSTPIFEEMSISLANLAKEIVAV